MRLWRSINRNSVYCPLAVSLVLIHTIGEHHRAPGHTPIIAVSYRPAVRYGAPRHTARWRRRQNIIWTERWWQGKMGGRDGNEFDSKCIGQRWLAQFSHRRRLHCGRQLLSPSINVLQPLGSCLITVPPCHQWEQLASYTRTICILFRMNRHLDLVVDFLSFLFFLLVTRFKWFLTRGPLLHP